MILVRDRYIPFLVQDRYYCIPILVPKGLKLKCNVFAPKDISTLKKGIVMAHNLSTSWT